VYEFDGPGGAVAGGNVVTHIVTAVAGHLMAVDFLPPFNSWQSCNPLALFDAPLVRFVESGKAAMEAQLVSLARRATTLVLWLDCDREGEGIAFEVMEVTARGNAHLTVRRAHFSSTAPAELQRALATLGVPDRRLADAVEARTELDLRLGAAFTRLQTVGLGARFDDLAGRVLSYGPCQFPTLGFVVQRYLDIAAFEPEPFWDLRLVYTPPGAGGGATAAAVAAADAAAAAAAAGEDDEVAAGGGGGSGSGGGSAVVFGWERGRLYDHLAALALFERAVEVGVATVLAVDGRPTTRTKPTPLNSVDFAAAASRLLRMASDAAAKVAEDLYTQGYISYPRTETQQFDDAIDLRGLVGVHRGQPAWGGYAARLLDDGGYEAPLKGAAHDKAHPPIHPLKAAVEADFADRAHWRVYEFITRHFLACCSRSALGAASKMRVAVGDEVFSAAGLLVLERNFLDVYPYTRWEGRQLPHLEVGATFVPGSLALHEGATAPPPLLAEHDLIHLMAANGIGTDATIPEHIAKVQEREYMMKNGAGRFTPSTLGVALLRGYDALELAAMSKPFLRASVEGDLARVCDGSKSRAAVVADCLAAMRPVYVATASRMDVMLSRFRELFDAVGSGAPVAPPAAGGAGVVACGGGCGRALDAKWVGSGQDRRLVLHCATCDAGFLLPRGAVHVAAAPGTPVCPACGYGVVSVTRSPPPGGGGDPPPPITLCPKCYLDPPPGASTLQLPAPDGGVLSLGANMDCRHCSHATCPLAGHAAPSGASPATRAAAAVAICGMPTCSGWLQLRRSAAGGFRVACDARAPPPRGGRGGGAGGAAARGGRGRGGGGAGAHGGGAGGSAGGCPHVVWLPRYVRAAAVAEGDGSDAWCARCSAPAVGLRVRKVDFCLAEGSVPAHMTAGAYAHADGTVYTTRLCIVCDRGDLPDTSEQPSVVPAAARLAQAGRYSLEPFGAAPGAGHAAGDATLPADPPPAFFHAHLPAPAHPALPPHAPAPPLPPPPPPPPLPRATAAVHDIEDLGGGALGGRYMQPQPRAAPPPRGGAGAGGGGSGSRAGAPAHAGGGDSDEMLPGPRAVRPQACSMHGTQPVLRTAGAASKEPGAKFWTCPGRGSKGTPDDCGMFVWVGMLDATGHAAGPGGGGGGGGGGGAGGGGEARGGRGGGGGYGGGGSLGSRAASFGGAPPGGGGASAGAGGGCYRCGQPGHFASRCPTGDGGGGGGGGYGSGAGGKRAAPTAAADDWAPPKRPRGPVAAAPPPADGGGGAGAKTVRKCTVCHQEGHTKARCPRNLERRVDYDD